MLRRGDERYTPQECPTGPILTVQGCSGVVHVASDVSFGADPNVVIPPVLKLADNLLHAAAKVPSVKRFVYTSSTSALADESGTGHLHLTTESWNEESLTAAYKEPFTPENALHVYSASKVLGERACFDFVKENKPGFVVNSVVPNFNIGPVIHPKLLSSTNMIVAGTFNSDPTALGYAHMILPQFSISLEDDGLLHLAGLTMEDVKNERLIAAADSFTFNDMLDIMAKFDPSKKLPERQPKNEQAKRTIDTSRSVEILKRFGKTGFTSVEESILQCLSTMPKA